MNTDRGDIAVVMAGVHARLRIGNLELIYQRSSKKAELQ